MILVQIFQASTVFAQKLVKILYEKWSLIELLLDNFLANRLSILTKFASKWNAVGRWPLLYWSAGLQSTTKNLTPSFWKTHEVKQKECVKREGWTNNQDILKKVISVQMNLYENSNIPSNSVNEWMSEWLNEQMDEQINTWLHIDFGWFQLAWWSSTQISIWFSVCPVIFTKSF